MTAEQEKTMTTEQIKNRLKALDMYEQSLFFSMPDEGDLTTREMTRVMIAKNKLRQMLKTAESA